MRCTLGACQGAQSSSVVNPLWLEHRAWRDLFHSVHKTHKALSRSLRCCTGHGTVLGSHATVSSIVVCDNTVVQISRSPAALPPRKLPSPTTFLTLAAGQVMAKSCQLQRPQCCSRVMKTPRPRPRLTATATMTPCTETAAAQATEQIQSSSSSSSSNSNSNSNNKKQQQQQQQQQRRRRRRRRATTVTATATNVQSNQQGKARVFSAASRAAAEVCEALGRRIRTFRIV